MQQRKPHDYINNYKQPDINSSTSKEEVIIHITRLIKQKNFLKSEEILNKLLASNPNHPDLLKLYKTLPLQRVVYTEDRDLGARASAQIYLNIIKNIINFDINSCIEFGCGQGSWISTAQWYFSLETQKCVGIDGAWAKDIQPPNITFYPADMNSPSWKKEMPLAKNYFDLGICVEVLEHLDEDKALQSLDHFAELTDLLVFGAAPPGQYGQGHINCHPQSYWASHLIIRGFEPIDCFRPILWNNDNPKPWYIQNTFLYCKTSSLNKLIDLTKLKKGDIDFNTPHPLCGQSVLHFSKKHLIRGLISK